MSKRAVLYARVSSDDRAKEGRNLKGQIEMGREYALTHGYTIIDEIAEDDRGARGADFDLPGLNKALEIAHNGGFDVLVVRELDRFARRLAKQLIMEEEFKQAGVRVDYVLGEYPDTPEGNLNKNIRAVIAEFEAGKIAQRMRRGRRNVVKNGAILLHGDRPPYGYRVSEDGKNLVPYEPEAAIIRLIYAWYVAGDETHRRLSTRAITEKLSQMGIPTWADIHGGRKKRGYGKWHKGVIREILVSETYKGTWYYGRRNHGTKRVVNPCETWIALKVPEIVTEEMWELAQKQREANTREMKRNVKLDYLLGRRIRCGQCGSSVCGISTKRKNKTKESKTYQYYCCIGKRGDIANVTCDLPYFRTDQVDAAVWEWVRSWLADPKQLREGLKAHQAEREKENEPLRRRLETVEGLIASNQAQLERLLDLYLSGDFPKEMLTERKSRLETTIQALEAEQAHLTATLEAQTLTKQQVCTLQDFAVKIGKGLEAIEADFEARRYIIEVLDTRATLAVEDGEKIVYASCNLGEGVLSVSSPTSRYSGLRATGRGQGTRRRWARGTGPWAGAARAKRRKLCPCCLSPAAADR